MWCLPFQGDVEVNQRLNRELPANLVRNGLASSIAGPLSPSAGGRQRLSAAWPTPAWLTRQQARNLRRGMLLLGLLAAAATLLWPNGQGGWHDLAAAVAVLAVFAGVGMTVELLLLGPRPR